MRPSRSPIFRNSDDDIRRLERARTSGDPQAGYALHAERLRAGLQLEPDETLSHVPMWPTAFVRFDRYYFTSTVGVEVAWRGPGVLQGGPWHDPNTGTESVTFAKIEYDPRRGWNETQFQWTKPVSEVQVSLAEAYRNLTSKHPYEGNPTARNTDESLRRLEREATATGDKGTKMRLAVERIRAGGGPEQPLREILEQANQATLAIARLQGLEVDDRTASHMTLPFEAVRELVAITAGDPRPRLFAYSSMPVSVDSFSEEGIGRPYPVTLALAVRDATNDAIVVGVSTTGNPYGSPSIATLRSAAWWTYQDRVPARGSISDLSRAKKLWVMPEISAYPDRAPPPGKRLTEIVLGWARRGDHEAYATPLCNEITFPIHGLRARLDLSEVEIWAARQPEEATTDERIEVADAMWIASLYRPSRRTVERERHARSIEDYLAHGLTGRPSRVVRFAHDYAAQWARFVSARSTTLFPIAAQQ